MYQNMHMRVYYLHKTTTYLLRFYSSGASSAQIATYISLECYIEQLLHSQLDEVNTKCP
jgi:hypothetical protein